jgi:hypothetical protein
MACDACAACLWLVETAFLQLACKFFDIVAGACLEHACRGPLFFGRMGICCFCSHAEKGQQ